MEAQQSARVSSAWWLLRIVFGFVPIVAGIDKFFDGLVDWPKYMAPFFADLIPMSTPTFMMVVGVIEIVAGVLVLAWTRVGAYVVAAWLLAISVNLLFAGYYDIAVRDLTMAAGAFVLGRLTEVAAPAGVPSGRAHRLRPAEVPT